MTYMYKRNELISLRRELKMPIPKFISGAKANQLFVCGYSPTYRCALPVHEQGRLPRFGFSSITITPLLEEEIPLKARVRLPKAPPLNPRAMIVQEVLARLGRRGSHGERKMNALIKKWAKELKEKMATNNSYTK